MQLTGNIKNATIRLTDMIGKILWESRNVNSNELQIPVSKFSSGTYLLTITSGAESKVLKLVKE